MYLDESGFPHMLNTSSLFHSYAKTLVNYQKIIIEGLMTKSTVFFFIEKNIQQCGLCSWPKLWIDAYTVAVRF